MLFLLFFYPVLVLAAHLSTSPFAFLYASWKLQQPDHLRLLHLFYAPPECACDCLPNMPTSKSSRSSKGSRPPLLSLPSMSNFLSTVSHSKDQHHEDSGLAGLGQPTKVHRLNTVDQLRHDESGYKPPQRTRSKMNVLTSLFSPTRSDSTKLSAPVTDNCRPKTAQEALPPSHIREKPIHRKPVASTVEFSTHSSFDDTTPRTPSNAHGSVSTIDNSPGANGAGVNTPSTQVSDFDFGFQRTESPEADHPSHDQTGADMPAVIQKHQRGVSSPPDRPSPVPPKLELPPQAQHTFQMTETPASPILSRKRSSSVQPRPNVESRDGRNRLQPTRRPSSPTTAPRPRSSSAHSQASHSRTVSTPVPKISNDGGDGRGRLRRSWLPGGRSRSASKDLKKMSANRAWIMSQDNHVDYNTNFLTNGEKVITPSVLFGFVTIMLIMNRSLNSGMNMEPCWYICSRKVVGKGHLSRFLHIQWRHR